MKRFDKFDSRVTIALLATIFIGISIGIMRVIAFGVDPFTSSIIGISNSSKIDFRYIYPIVNAVILILIFFLNRPMIGMGTLINLLVIGPVTDYSQMFINNLYTNPSLLKSIGLLIFANLLMAFNVSLYANVDIGVSAYDSLFITINKKNPKLSLGLSRIITDGVSILMGYLGKAPLGLGTVINLLLMGPLVEFFTKTSTKKILNMFNISLPLA
ncbi:YitT family protein [Anaerococcus sp. ENR1011]|uniref:YitT family protein n=1 Tax=Anaerococcus groningensis TaxID=3115616 RepID=A0ABW9MZ94_9FIRM